MLGKQKAEERSTIVMAESVVKEYRLQYELAKGHLGVVYRAEHIETREEVAVKVVSTSQLRQAGLNELENEAKRAVGLTSPHIVPLKDFIRTPTFAYFITPFQRGGDLESFIKRSGPPSEAQATPWLFSIIQALLDLKALGLMHRDVKLSHVLVDEEGHARLTGLGFAKETLSTAHSLLGTPMYMAPEVVGRRAYDYKADVWSYGILMFRLLFASEPFQVATIDQLIVAQKQGVSLPRFSPLSAQAKNLLLSLLQFDPASRPTYEEILQHPFFQPIPPVEAVSTPSNIQTRDESQQEDANVTQKLDALKGSHLEQLAEEQPQSPSCETFTPCPVSPQQLITSPSTPFALIGSTSSIDSHNALLYSSGDWSILSTSMKEDTAQDYTVMEAVEEVDVRESQFNDQFSMIDMFESESPKLHADDWKQLKSVAERYRTSGNFLLARTILRACEQTYLQERKHAERLLVTLSMNESYIGQLIAKTEEHLHAIRREIEKVGTGRVATHSEMIAELNARLTLTTGCEDVIRHESLEATLVLAKVARSLGCFEDEVQRIEERCRLDLHSLT